MSSFSLFTKLIKALASSTTIYTMFSLYYEEAQNDLDSRLSAPVVTVINKLGTIRYLAQNMGTICGYYSCLS